MSQGFSTRLDQVQARADELRAILSGALDGTAFIAASREYAEIEPIATEVAALRRAERELADAAGLKDDPAADAEMRAMADAEWRLLRDQVAERTRAVQLALLPRDEADARNAILEIRAGTGGDEAALFAADLFEMYRRYAEARGWRFGILDMSENDLGGYREVTAEVSGHDVFARLKFESGVHRVQRVPATESQGRIHTSAATVAVLPEAEETDVRIEDKDLRIDVYRAQGAGGQHVNKTESAVRITHLPTGTVAQCQDEKSQHKNKAQAMKILRARLYEADRAAKAATRADMRRAQVGSGDRSERIRTYNFPQNRLTDHRIDLTLYKLDRVMMGALDEVFDALLSEDQAARLAQVA